MSLESRLTQMEDRQSLLETALRQDSLTPIQGVLLQDTLKGIRFQTASLPFDNNGVEDPLLEAVGCEDKPVGKRVAVLFSGGPAAGGHNVLVGLQHYLGLENTLLGVRRGPKGLLEGDFFEITEESVKTVQNLGGFDFLMSDRTKIKTEEQFQKVINVVETHRLDGIIIIGGDDSNTNAAILSERLLSVSCTVVGVPKTIDGDLQIGNLLPISFGFDTATKVYAEMVGNILQDTASSVKYWHFVKLMGRSASHVTLEVGLQTRPAITLVSEEIAEKAMSLDDIVNVVAAVVLDRAKNGVHHGVALVPEGLIEFIPEFKSLISELNEVMASLQVKDMSFDAILEDLSSKISVSGLSLLKSLPVPIAETLLGERDSHGNVQVSLIPTEQLLAQMVAQKIAKVDKPNGFKFGVQTHFFGYEGRCGAPTRFDAMFTYNLGIVAGALVAAGKTGYMAAITDFGGKGKALGIPLQSLISTERRHGRDERVIAKALVSLDSKAFRYFASRRDTWSGSDHFSSPGPRQYWGETANQMPISVALNSECDSLNYNF